MPTIIDLARGTLIAAAVWFGGMAALTLAVEHPELIVFAPAASLEHAIDRTGAAVTGFGRGYVLARANTPGLARRLYAEGAWFVWPALGRSCAAERPKAG